MHFDLIIIDRSSLMCNFLNYYKTPGTGKVNAQPRNINIGFDCKNHLISRKIICFSFPRGSVDGKFRCTFFFVVVGISSINVLDVLYSVVCLCGLAC